MRKRKRAKYPKVERIADITVYPEFCSFVGKHSIPSEIPLCEADDGSVCFTSEAEKKKYMKRVYNKRCILKRQVKVV